MEESEGKGLLQEVQDQHARVQRTFVLPAVKQSIRIPAKLLLHCTVLYFASRCYVGMSLRNTSPSTPRPLSA